MFAPLLLGPMLHTRTGTWTRVVAVLVAAALVGWGVISSLDLRSAAQPVAAASSTPTASSVDLVDAASVALQDCAPATAPSVPNGASASREEMTAARAAFQAYDAATNSYVHCVDTTIERLSNQYAGVVSTDELKSLKAFGLGAHDTAIDQEQAVADQFNAQIRTFKAKHPQS
jgi:hypothetical protein